MTTTNFITKIVRITKKQDNALKAASKSEKFQLSPWVREQLDKKFFGDPDFIDDQIQSNEILIKELTQINKKLRQEKLDVIVKKQKERDLLKTTRPKRFSYGELEKKDKGGN